MNGNWCISNGLKLQWLVVAAVIMLILTLKTTGVMAQSDPTLDFIEEE